MTRRFGVAAWAWVAGLAVTYAGIFSLLSLRRHEGFYTARYDLGNMTQAVWSVAHGDLFRVTDGAGVQMSRLGAHVDPILGLLAPLWRLWPDPALLLVVQSIAVGSMAVPAFLLARRWLADDRLAVAFAAASLLLPALQWATLFDFHPVTLAAPLLLWCVWAADSRHDVTLGVVAALALMTKEQVGLALAMLGLWMAISLGRRRAGAILAAVSLAWTAIAFLVVIPYFNDGAGSTLVESRYGGLRSDPVDAVRSLFSGDRLVFVAALLLPMLGLCLRAPLLSACALPELLLNLLSDRPEQHHVEYHYGAVIVPFVVAGSIRGLAAIRAGRGPAWLARVAHVPVVVIGSLAVGVLIGGWLLGPLPFWRHLPGGATVRVDEYSVPARASVMRQAVELIPSDAVVSAGNRLGGHLSARERILAFPVIDDAEYVVVDTTRFEVEDRVDPAISVAAVMRLRADARFRVRFERDGVVVFTRVGAGA